MELLLGAFLFCAGCAVGAAQCRREEGLPVFGHSAAQRRMQRQFENFLNYDGSERGQMSLAEREFSEGDI